ncbi:MAG: preprotein translocase subunit SecE [Planctomycetes bacterium]|nr:preprotein translocase subunit SecE [Planctomycetota bacterium]
MFKVHKPGQAKLTRTITFLAGLFLVVWGCRSALIELPSFWRRLGDSWNEILLDAKPTEAWTADLVLIESKFSPALTMAAVLLVLATLWVFWILNRPKVADSLVDMESELQKVSWPSFSDAWQSTLVVSGFTALIVGLVFGYDLVIKGIIELIVPRGGI